MRSVLRSALVLALLVSFAVPSASAQIYVDADNGPSGCSGVSDPSGLDGSSWDCAYPNLQDAVGVATGNDEIWIAEGVYYPDEGSGIPDNKADTSFVITGDQDGLEVYGGFQSGDDFADRDPDANVTVLSGNIDGDDNTNADGVTPTAGDISGTNSTHVFVFDGGYRIGADVSANVTTATVLDGVVVTAGQANGSREKGKGGGIYCDGGQGGASQDRCNPTLRNVDFYGNAAVLGGAIFDQTLGNTGGGISSPRIVDAVFSGNTASQPGGAIYNNAINGGTSSPEIINAAFTGNSAQAGGAIFNQAGTGTSSPQITNTTFTGNSANDTDTDGGGAIYNGAFSDGTSNPQITNTILWGNTAATDDGDEIFNGGGGSSTIDYSIVEDGDNGIANGSGFSAGTGNKDQDPQFADADGPDGTIGTPDDDVRLQGPGSDGGASPAIDAGDNTAISIGEDLAGNDRKQEVGSVTDTGNGSSPVVDMGPFESDGSVLPVEMASFEGTTTEEGVQLQWQTVSEQNNAGFRVERSVGARERGGESAWTQAGFVEGAGTTSEAQTYRFTDADLPYAADSLRYRLKQIDTDGSTTLTDPVTVQRGTVTSLELVGTAPNPARQRTRVRYAVPEGSGGDVTMHLYDVMGRQVRTVESSAEAGRHQRTLDVSDLAGGVYVLRLQAGGQAQTRKLTIVR